MGASMPNIADLLASSIEHCQYTDIAGDFGDGGRNGILFLRMAGLRLSRWGTVMNVREDPYLEASQLNGSVVQVRTEFQQLLNHFREVDLAAQRSSTSVSRVVRRSSDGSSSDSSNSSSGLLSSAEQDFVDKVQEICLRRQGSGAHQAPSQAITWQVKRQEDLEKLMGKVLRSLDRLDMLRPAASASSYAKLASRDSEQLSLAKLKVLKGIIEMAQTVDPRLAQSCEPKSQGHTYRSVRVKGYSVGNGDWTAQDFSGQYKSEGNHYEEIVVENGELRNGNSYGGSGFFSSE